MLLRRDPTRARPSSTSAASTRPRPRCWSTRRRAGPRRGYLGNALPGAAGTADIVVHRGAGAYICGEETALLQPLNGDRGQPTAKPPFPAVVRRLEEPTLLNNVETLADRAVHPRDGRRAVRRSPHRADHGHARLMSLSGHVQRPGNYELPVNATYRDLIEGCGGGMPDGRAMKCFVPGGSSTPILMPDELDVALAFETVAAAGLDVRLGRA